MKKAYKVEVDCANCANKMEEAVRSVSGVKDAALNFIALKLYVEFQDGFDHDEVMREALRRCRKVAQDCEIYM